MEPLGHHIHQGEQHSRPDLQSGYVCEAPGQHDSLVSYKQTKEDRQVEQQTKTQGEDTATED